MAREYPDSDLEYVARIDMKDEFVLSTWADDKLFFRHHDFQEDINLCPPEEQMFWTPTDDLDPDLEEWGNTPIDPLPEERADAEFIIAVGQYWTGCPFAWAVSDIDLSAYGLGIW